MSENDGSAQKEFASKIAGDVVLSEEPSAAMRRWRGRLAINQSSVAEEMGISPSVLSDYETGRRSSPGAAFIRRYALALVKLDQLHYRVLSKSEVKPADRSAILSIGEFKEPVAARRIVRMVDGTVITGSEKLNNEIYGYTVLDSIKTIYTLSGFGFYSIFGATTERVLVFTKVGLGRSPMVAIRVGHLKPRMVVMHGPKEVDRVGVELAERERIILVLASGSEEKILHSLSNLSNN
jgi:putative transcriptional regulator